MWWVWGTWERSSASPRNAGVDSAVSAASLPVEHMESLGVNRAVQMVKRATGVEGGGKGGLSRGDTSPKKGLRWCYTVWDI